MQCVWYVCVIHLSVCRNRPLCCPANKIGVNVLFTLYTFRHIYSGKLNIGHASFRLLNTPSAFGQSERGANRTVPPPQRTDKKHYVKVEYCNVHDARSHPQHTTQQGVPVKHHKKTPMRD